MDETRARGYIDLIRRSASSFGLVVVVVWLVCQAQFGDYQMLSSSRILGIGMAAALAVSAHTHSSAATYAQARLTLGGMTVVLDDLDPNDGIEPSVTFSGEYGPVSLNGQVFRFAGPPQPDDNLGASPPAQPVFSDLSVAIAGAHFDAGSDILGNLFSGLTFVTFANAYIGEYSATLTGATASATNGATSNQFFAGLKWNLTPNTRMGVNFHVQHTLNAVSTARDPNQAPHATAINYFQIQMDPWIATHAFADGFEFAAANHPSRPSSIVKGYGEYVGFTNVTNDYVDGRMNITMWSTVGVSAAAVPEASTLMQLIAGLAVMTGFAVRHRRSF